MANIGTLDFTIKTLGNWMAKFREKGTNLIHATDVNDIYTAKDQGKLGVIFHFQGTTPFEGDINTVELYHRLGVRMCQLCYNEKDLVGCGCSVEEDTGITEFGEQVIGEITGKIGSSINLRSMLQTAVEELGRNIPGSEIVIELKSDQGKTQDFSSGEIA